VAASATCIRLADKWTRWMILSPTAMVNLLTTKSNCLNLKHARISVCWPSSSVSWLHCWWLDLSVSWLSCRRLGVYRARSGTVWDGTPYRHFPGRVKIIPSLLSREVSYRYACTKFGELILEKIINIVATRCHILNLKCTTFDFGWGCAPEPAGGAYSAAETP